jgi:pyrimidine operon attenuation protein/uracil phosphoribosyltransferase
MLSTIEIIPVDTLEHILIEIYYRIISRTFKHRYLQPILIGINTRGYSDNNVDI